MKKKKETPQKVILELDEKHLPTLVNALETYSRLRSGQIKMALDAVYWDANLTYEECQYIENAVRYVVFPRNIQRDYDCDYKEYHDQYGNEYDENGNIVEESEDWKRKKDRHHLNSSNCSFGVNCKEHGDGTEAWIIKKVLDQYLHYKWNDGYRNVMDVSGDGARDWFGSKDIVHPKILNFDPSKTFPLPKRYWGALDSFYEKKDFMAMWDIVDKSFKKKPLPKGSSSEIKKVDDEWVVIVKEPYKMKS
jgi:hypothetical protein